MATAIRDLFVSVTTKVDASGLATLDKKLDGAKDKFGKFAAFIAGGFIAKGVATFIKGQLDFADHLQDTSTKLGIATDDLERFGFVAQLSGSSAEEMYSSLNKMNKAIGDNSAAFGKLGISLKNSDGSAKSTKDVFTEVTERFRNEPDPCIDRGKRRAQRNFRSIRGARRRHAYRVFERGLRDERRARQVRTSHARGEADASFAAAAGALKGGPVHV